MNTTNHPPISPEPQSTTQPNEAIKSDWIPEYWESRQWGIEGKVLTHHDSHGLSYEVEHPDKTVGHYDPSELEEV